MKTKQTIAGREIELDDDYSYLATRAYLKPDSQFVPVFIICLNPEVSEGTLVAATIDDASLIEAEQFVVEFNNEVMGTLGRHWE